MTENFVKDKQEIDTLFNLLKESVNRLYIYDEYIISERMEMPCSARIMFYMQTLLLTDMRYSSYKNYHVDLEYRKYMSVKKVTSKRRDGIRPDLLVHRRGEQDNLIVIEFKMDNEELEQDKSKLRELTSNVQKYKYRLGVLCVIGKDAPRYHCYIGGDEVE